MNNGHMNAWEIIVGILLFALVTMILYIWGLKKSLGKDLERDLMSACGSRVIKYLKKHDTITEAETAALIEGITAGPFWSKEKATIQDGKKAAPQVLTFLTEQLYIEKISGGRFKLRK